MRVFLTQIPVTGRSFAFELAGNAIRDLFADRPDLQRFAGGWAEIYAERLDQIVTLRGTIDFDMSFLCSRCGQDAEAHVRLSYRMVLMPRPADRRRSDEDEGTGFHNGRTIDLERLVLDHIALQLPDVLLCRPDCPGVDR